MFVRKKRHRSGNIGVIVVEKTDGKMKELATIGIAHSANEVESLVNEAKEWISRENVRRHPQLDLFGEEYVYWCIVTNGRESDEASVIETYNRRGARECDFHGPTTTSVGSICLARS